MGHNCAKASTANALVLLNQWWFVAGKCPVFSPACLCSCLSLSDALFVLFLLFCIYPVVFCSVVPFRGVTTNVHEHTGGDLLFKRGTVVEVLHVVQADKDLL